MATTDKRVVISADHGAVDLKQDIGTYLKSVGFGVNDIGVFDTTSVDYPDTSAAACKEYLSGDYAFGIVLCGTGIGASIAANKIEGIRCALVHDLFTARMARAHNNANFLAFGGRVSYDVRVERMIDAFLEARFEGERHARRIAKLTELDRDTGSA